jgi:hypothetical protein
VSEAPTLLVLLAVPMAVTTGAVPVAVAVPLTLPFKVTVAVPVIDAVAEPADDHEELLEWVMVLMPVKVPLTSGGLGRPAFE